jgi:hypothetical protein
MRFLDALSISSTFTLSLSKEKEIEDDELKCYFYGQLVLPLGEKAVYWQAFSGVSRTISMDCFSGFPVSPVRMYRSA